MRWPTGTDVTALRQNAGNYSRFYLGVQQGKERTSGCGVHAGAGTIYMGCHYQLGATDTYDANEHSLTFGTVGILGATDIRPGMTLACGTLADPFAYGSARIRLVDAANDILYLEPNNLVAEGYLAAGDYIWVDGVYRLYRKLPHIVNGVVYEDGNPDTILGAGGIPGYGIPFAVNYLDRPVALMGSPRVAWTGEAINLYGWRSFGRGGNTIATYTWDLDGGVAGGAGVNAAGTPANPVTGTWNTAGEYILSLTVADNSGKVGNDAYGVAFTSHVAVRPVLVYDRPGEGSDTPYTDFEVDSLQGSYGSGWSLRVTVYGTADKSEFPDNALVVLFCEDWHGGTEGSRGGWYGQENILFTGYIRADSVTVDSEKSSVSFEAQTIEQWAKEIDCWPCNFESTAGAPTAWHEFQAMTCEDVLWFLSEFRSTLKDITDCFYCSDPDGAKLLGFVDVTEADLYDQLSGQVGSCFFGTMSSSRHSSLHLFKHKNMLDIAERMMFGPPVWVFSKEDWRDELEVGEERMRDSVAQVDFIGFIYNASGNPQEVYSLSPANQTNFGRIEKVDGILLSGNTIVAAQPEANTLSGLYRAWKNIRFPHVRVPARNNRFLEPATLDYFGIVLDTTDTIRGYDWEGKEFLCTGVSYEINQEGGIVLADISGEASTWGPDGVAGDYLEGIPDVPDNPPEYFGIWPGATGSPPGETPPPWSDADEWEPGGWQLEHDPGMTGEVYEMCYFSDDVFGFCEGGTGHGVWRRTPPNWTRTIVPASSDKMAVWNGYMWCGDGANIQRSADGIAWAVDHNFGPGGYTEWSAMGAWGSYLLMAMVGFHAVAGTTFYRRDTLGNYVAFPPWYNDVNDSVDIGGLATGYIFWSAQATDVRRYYTAWEPDPILNLASSCFFTVHEGVLYASGALNGARVWRREGGMWVREFRSDDATTGCRAISIGGNDKLYLAVTDLTDTDVYVRTSSGDWAWHSTVTGTVFYSVGANADGDLFAGTDSCEFWKYVPT